MLQKLPCICCAAGLEHSAAVSLSTSGACHLLINAVEVCKHSSTNVLPHRSTQLILHVLWFHANHYANSRIPMHKLDYHLGLSTVSDDFLSRR